MGASTLSSRAVVGEFYKRLDIGGVSWPTQIGTYFTSDQASEEYPFLGMSPMMREWVGGRVARGFREDGITIKNTHYEATLEVLVDDMRRDKTGQIMARIRDLADRTNAHWAKLATDLIVAGESTVCYDGQFFFDTDHAEGNSGTQSNDITVDISDAPGANKGTATAPSTEMMAYAIHQAIAQMMGFVDDEGEPLNENASRFLVMAPPSLSQSVLSAITSQRFSAGQDNFLLNFDLAPVINARLAGSWTDKIAVFRTDANVGSIILQEEKPVELKVQAEGSPLEFERNMHQYGVDTWRGVGYGHWQYACLAQLVA